MIATEKSKMIKSTTKKKRGIIKAKTDFFRDARYGLTLQEHRIIYYAILTGQQNDKPFEPVTVSVKEFKEICGLQGQSTYSELIRITENLIGKSVEFMYMTESGKHLTQATWVTSVTYHQKEGTVTIVPNKELQMFFNNPARNYSTTEYYYLIKFKSEYAERLYELLKAFDNKLMADFLIDDLREKLAIDKKSPSKRKNSDKPEKKKYSNYADFLKRVLIPAVADINKYTDLDVSFEETRGTYNKVTKVNFSIKKKDVPLLYDREQNGEFMKHSVPDEPIEGQVAFWDSFGSMREGDVGVILAEDDLDRNESA